MISPIIAHCLSGKEPVRSITRCVSSVNTTHHRDLQMVSHHMVHNIAGVLIAAIGAGDRPVGSRVVLEYRDRTLGGRNCAAVWPSIL